MPHKFCPKCDANRDLAVTCDFCVHYAFNGEDLPLPAKPGNGQLYVGKGWCDKYERAEDPGGPVGPCDDFECGMDEGKAVEDGPEVKSAAKPVTPKGIVVKTLFWSGDNKQTKEVQP